MASSSSHISIDESRIDSALASKIPGSQLIGGDRSIQPVCPGSSNRFYTQPVMDPRVGVSNCSLAANHPMQELPIGLSTASCLREHETESVNNVDVPGIISEIRTLSEPTAGSPVLQTQGSLASYILTSKQSMDPRNGLAQDFQAPTRSAIGQSRFTPPSEPTIVENDIHAANNRRLLSLHADVSRSGSEDGEQHSFDHNRVLSAETRCLPVQCLPRGRGKQGPDFRLAPLEESPVTYALRTSINRPDEPIFMPYVGLEFNSAKEAKDFYNLYSWEIGFGIRKGRNPTNDNNYMTRQDIVCHLIVAHREITRLVSLHAEAGHVFANCAARLGLHPDDGDDNGGARISLQPHRAAQWKRRMDLREAAVCHAHDALLALSSAAAAITAAEDFLRWRSAESPRREGWQSAARQLVKEARYSLGEAKDAARLMRDAVLCECFVTWVILTRG